nr:hypothetical protein [Tanacetum cinerariifolium]
PGYKTWVHHGELDLPTPPPVKDNTRQTQMSYMIALLNDLSYIPPNNDQNETTQGDIGETSNELAQAKNNEFKELYASANEELYLGCDYVTRLDFMEKFTYFKVKGKLTNSILNEILEFFQHVFPTMKGYKFPPSYYAIKKTFKTIGLGYESIHACVNDCFLYRGDNNNDVHFGPLHCKGNDLHATGKCMEPGLAADGFNPFGNLSQAYNIPKSPGKDINVYLRPLIDDLKVLWALKGVKTIYVAIEQKFNMRVMVL